MCQQFARLAPVDNDETLNDPRLTAMGLLIEVHRGVTAKTASAFAEDGLTGVDFDVLIRLARSTGVRLRMSDLAAQTPLTTSGITRAVDRLERRGVLCREACPGDRRGSFAVLTGAGSEQLTTVLPALLGAIERWFTGLLEPMQLEALLATLRVVRDGVHPGAAAGADQPSTAGRRPGAA